MPNSTTFTGNLTREPDIRYTQDGLATALLTVAVDRRWLDRESREWEEAVSFFDVVCWRELAENVALSLAKGMRVMVSGRLEQRTWETDQGERRSKVEVVADEIGASLRFATVDVHRATRTTPAEFTEEVELVEADKAADPPPEPRAERPAPRRAASRADVVIDA